MDLTMMRALVECRPSIRAHWEKLLRLDRGVSALARPDTLVHLIDPTLDEFYATLPDWSPRRHPSRTPEPACPCGASPYIAYFTAGRQALHEGMVTIQARLPGLTAQARDEAFTRINQVFALIARREIESFCSVCQLRPAMHRPDHSEAGRVTVR